MSELKISIDKKDIKGKIILTASKSESNRALLIRALTPEDFTIDNLAIAKDTDTMVRLLNQEGCVKDVGPAGTTMRFLTAYYASTPGKWMMTGSERMKERPIHILVDALRSIGAEIEYMEKEGCPPLKIKGKKLTGGTIEIDGSVSSQFLSALIMIAPTLKGGLKMKLVGKVASVPYLNMTLRLIEKFGAKYSWTENVINIEEGNYHPQKYKVEADWSGASYWYQIAALSNTCELEVEGLKNDSLQGDRVIVELFEKIGVSTTFTNKGIKLQKKEEVNYPEFFEYDFSDCPDVAQTVAATVGALGIKSHFKGLESLRIKETDRIVAIKNELQKFNVEVVDLPGDEIQINPNGFITPKKSIQTYEDHRVAMSIAPLALKTESPIVIEEPEVVEKSYPEFWNDLKSVGFNIDWD